MTASRRVGPQRWFGKGVFIYIAIECIAFGYSHVLLFLKVDLIRVRVRGDLSRSQKKRYLGRLLKKIYFIPIVLRLNF